MDWKTLKALADDKAKYIEDVPDDFMTEVYKAQDKLYIILRDFVDTLDSENENIVYNQANITKISRLDQLWNDYQSTIVFNLVGNLIDKLQNVVKTSNQYYRSMLQFSNDFKISGLPKLSGFSTPYKAGYTNLKGTASTELKISSFVNARLGIKADGGLVKGGYLYNIYQNTAPLNQSREIMFNAVTSNMPVKELKKKLKEEIAGFDSKLPNEQSKAPKGGTLAKDYAVITNDVFAKVDRSAAIIVKNDNELRYFIYGGTIRKNTRPFCRPKVNKAFSTKEAEKWIDEVPGPIAVDKGTYDPLVNCGGIFCKHSPLFITSELYEVLKLEGSDIIPEPSK